MIQIVKTTFFTLVQQLFKQIFFGLYFQKKIDLKFKYILQNNLNILNLFLIS